MDERCRRNSGIKGGWVRAKSTGALLFQAFQKGDPPKLILLVFRKRLERGMFERRIKGEGSRVCTQKEGLMQEEIHFCVCET